jgi:hypothetical protein
MIEERRNAIRDAAMASLQAGAPLADIIADAVELGLNWTATGSGPGEDVVAMLDRWRTVPPPHGRWACGCSQGPCRFDWKRIVFPGTSGGALPSVRYEVTCTTHGLVGMSAPVTSDASITDRRVLTINALNALNTAHAEDCR